jgi:hypothetical protein
MVKSRTMIVALGLLFLVASISYGDACYNFIIELCDNTNECIYCQDERAVSPACFSVGAWGTGNLVRHAVAGSLWTWVDSNPISCILWSTCTPGAWGNGKECSGGFDANTLGCGLSNNPAMRCRACGEGAPQWVEYDHYDNLTFGCP